LFVHICAWLRNCTQLSRNWTKLCYILCYYPVDFVSILACARTIDHQIHQTSADDPPDCHVWDALQCFRHFTFKARNHSAANKCTEVDLRWVASDNNNWTLLASSSTTKSSWHWTCVHISHITPVELYSVMCVASVCMYYTGAQLGEAPAAGLRWDKCTEAAVRRWRCCQ